MFNDVMFKRCELVRMPSAVKGLTALPGKTFGSRGRARSPFRAAIVLPVLICTALYGCKNPETGVDQSDCQWLERATLEELNAYIESNTNNPAAYYERGKRYAEEGVYPEVLADSITCIERWPDLFHGYWLRGWLLKEQRDFAAALPDYNKALTLAPEKRRIYIQRGEVHAQLYHGELALADFSKAIEMEPSDYNP